MKLLFTMMISSNILFLLFLLVNHFFGNYFSAHWKCGILKFALLISLLPFAYIKPLIRTLLQKLLKVPASSVYIFDGSRQILFTPPNHFNMNLSLKVEVSIFIIWMIIGIITFLYRFYHYLHLKKTAALSMQEVSEPTMLKLFARLSDEFQLRRTVALYTCNASFSPFTMGVFKPIIIMPCKLTPEEQELVLRHELCHIKNNDNLFIFIRLLATGLYWFNPFMFMLDSYIEKNSELACDETVIQGNTQEQRWEYGRLIIEMASSKTDPMAVAMYFSEKDNFKERITYIMRQNKMSKKAKFLSFLLTTIMILCSSFPALAYQTPQIFNMSEEDGNPVYISPNEFITFELGDSSLLPEEQILYDSQFITNDGVIYKIDDSKPSFYAKCSHTCEEGTSTQHNKKSDGSCVTKYYESKRCSKCGHFVKGKLKRTATSKPCPH